jgi:hypothetical protein
MAFSGNLVASDLETFARGYAVTLSGGTTVTRAVTFENTGGVTFGGGATYNFNGGLTSTAGTTSLAGIIATTNDSVTLGALSLTGNATIRTGSGAVIVASATDGAGSFVLTLGGVSQSGLIRIDGALNVNGLATASAAYGVSLLGGGTIDTATSFANTGTVTLGDATGDVFLFDGGLSFGGNGAVSLGATVRTSGDVIDFGSGALTLSQNTVVDSTNNGGAAGGANITFGGTVDGGKTLTVNAGTGGDVFLDGVVGGSTALSSLSVTSAANSTHIAANVTTVGDQTYVGGVVLEADVSLTATAVTGEFPSGGRWTATGRRVT